MFYYVYKLTSPDMLHYIGVCSTSLKQRWASHRCHWKISRSRETTGCSPKLFLAFDKFNPYCGKWIQEVLFYSKSKSKAERKEKEFITTLNTMENGYNCVLGTRKGVKLTLQHCSNISQSLTGRKLSDETKKKKSIAMTGIKMLPQTKTAILQSISRTWKITLPDNTTIQIVNLKEYARKNKLTYQRLIEGKHSKGHKAIQI